LKDNTEKVNNSIILSFKELISKIEESHNAIQQELQTINATVAQQRLEVEDLVMKQNTFMKNLSGITTNAFNDIKNDLQLVFNGQSE